MNKVLLALVLCGACLYAEPSVKVQFIGLNDRIEREIELVNNKLRLMKPPIYEMVDIELNGAVPEFDTVVLGFFNIRNFEPDKFGSCPFIKKLQFYFMTLKSFDFLNQMPYLEQIRMEETFRIGDLTFDIANAKSLEYFFLHGGNWKEFPRLIAIPPDLKYINISYAIINEFPEEIMAAWANNPYGVKLVLIDSDLPEKYHHYEAFVVEDELDTIPREDREKYGF